MPVSRTFAIFAYISSSKGSMDEAIGAASERAEVPALLGGHRCDR